MVSFRFWEKSIIVCLGLQFGSVADYLVPLRWSSSLNRFSSSYPLFSPDSFHNLGDTMEDEIPSQTCCQQVQMQDSFWLLLLCCLLHFLSNLDGSWITNSPLDEIPKRYYLSTGTRWEISWSKIGICCPSLWSSKQAYLVILSFNSRLNLIFLEKCITVIWACCNAIRSTVGMAMWLCGWLMSHGRLQFPTAILISIPLCQDSLHSLMAS